MRRAVTAYPHASVIPAKAGVQKAKNWVPAFAGTSGRGVAFALLFFGLGLHGARAQDVRGLEVCTAEKQMERRTGCLQANIVEADGGTIVRRAGDGDLELARQIREFRMQA